MCHNYILEWRNSLHIHACERFYFERHTGSVETTVNVTGMRPMWLSAGYFSVFLSWKLHTSWRKKRRASWAGVLHRCRRASDVRLCVLCGCSNLSQWAPKKWADMLSTRHRCRMCILGVRFSLQTCWHVQRSADRRFQFAFLSTHRQKRQWGQCYYLQFILEFIAANPYRCRISPWSWN